MTVTALEKTPVVVSAESIDEGADEIIFSNVSVVNALLSELLTEDEISDNALRSYYVDFYMTQVLNGGFAQFIYESGWQADINERILEGLNAMGAADHAALFEKAVTTFEDLDDEAKEYFLSGEFEDGLDEDFDDDDDNDDNDEDTDADKDKDAVEPGQVEAAGGAAEPGGESDEDDEDDDDDVEDDTFDDIDEAFYALSDIEELTVKNAAWLRTLPELQVLPREEISGFVEACVARIPDLAERREAAEELYDDEMPEFERTIRVLCEVAEQELEAITIGDPSFEWEGEETLAWHFVTDAGEYLMVETEDEALMINGETREVIAAVEFDDDDDLDDEDLDDEDLDDDEAEDDVEAADMNEADKGANPVR